MGRKAGDQILGFFASSLKNVFGSQEGTFIGYNGSGQFLIFVKKCTESELNDMQRHLNVILDARYTETKVRLQYSIGIAVATGIETSSLRTLIGIASKGKKQYEAGMLKEA